MSVFTKPTKYALEKQRDAVRAELMVRSRGLCEMTFLGGTLEMHECHKRSQTVNMPVDLRYNSRWCLLLKPLAHAMITDGMVMTYFADIDMGANGKVFYVRRGNGVPLVEHFTARQVWEHYRDTVRA